MAYIMCNVHYHKHWQLASSPSRPCRLKLGANGIAMTSQALLAGVDGYHKGPAGCVIGCWQLSWHKHTAVDELSRQPDLVCACKGSAEAAASNVSQHSQHSSCRPKLF